MAYNKQWIDYFAKRLADAEEELAGFEITVAEYGGVFEREESGDRDVTDRERKMLQYAVEEYRRCLRD